MSVNCNPPLLFKNSSVIFYRPCCVRRHHLKTKKQISKISKLLEKALSRIELGEDGCMRYGPFDQIQLDRLNAIDVPTVISQIL